jgi:hypothetical protein
MEMKVAAMDIEMVVAKMGMAVAETNIEMVVAKMGMAQARGIALVAAAMDIQSLMLLLWFGQFPKNKNIQIKIKVKI